MDSGPKLLAMRYTRRISQLWVLSSLAQTERDLLSNWVLDNRFRTSAGRIFRAEEKARNCGNRVLGVADDSELVAGIAIVALQGRGPIYAGRLQNVLPC